MPDGIKLGGAYYELSADDAALIRALARSQTQAKSFSDAIARSMGSAANATDASMKRMTASTQQASVSFTSLARSSLGFVTAAAGVTTGALAINQAMTRVAESTQKAADTQFKLTRVYGTSASEMATFANGLARATGNSNQAVQEGVARFAVLMRGYGLTRAQVEKLTVATLDLAAANGVDTVEAFERMIGVFRDGGESAEKLSLVLNDQTIKSVANLTAEQKKNFEQMGAVEKSQIRYAEAMRQAAAFTGSAAEKAGDASGAFKVLDASIDNLSVTIGQRFAPGLAVTAQAMTFLATATDTFLTTASPQAIAAVVSQFGALGVAIAGIIRMFPQLAAGPAGIPTPIGPDPGMPGGTTGGLGHEAARNAIIAIQEERKRQAKRELEAADKANDATAESAIRAIDKERKAKEQWYDEEKQRIEARRTYQLEDIETRKDAAIAALEEEKRAAKDAIEAQIEDQERLKDARIDAAEQAAEQAKQAIDAEKDRLDRVRDLEDRAREDERRLEDQAREDAREADDRAIEDARRAEDRDRERSQQAEIKRLEDLRDARIDAIEAAIEKEQEAAEQRLRNLDREADTAKANSDKALARLERRGEKEDEQHRRRMQALDDEQDAQLDILDAQLRALDAQERQADAAERLAGIQKRLAAAQKTATAVRGTGTPAEIAAARGDLTTALRVGNEVSIANARERLVQLAGRGNEAIQKADEELAEAQADLAREGVDTARDAEREKIRAAQDAVRDRIEAQKREAEEEDRQRKQSLERDQEAERAKLQSRLARLEKQKQAAKDDGDEDLKRLREGVAAERKASEERIDATKQRFADDKQILDDRRREEDRYRQDQREAQDRQRDEERQAQDRFRADERTEQDRALAVQLAAVNATLAQERKDTEAHFNGPNGTITQLKKAIEDSELLYSRRLAAARAAYEDERKAAERLYTNPEGNGELQLLEKQRQAESAALEARKTDYQEQAKAFSEMIKGMMADIDAFIAKQQSIPRIGGNVEAVPRTGGSGSLTSSSAVTTRSRTSGKEVQGDVTTWLNDAMDLTGVPDSWLPGLKGILDRESFGGDPHAKNPNSTASGLFQLIDSTWAAYRDKKLPNNVFDPVANAVAGIRYIKDRYGSPSKAIEFWERQNPHWYDAGGMIREPVIGRGLRSGNPYAFAEYGPEYVIGRKATAMLGSGPPSSRAGIGAWISQAHPGGGGYVDSSSVNFYGLTYEQAETRQRREQRRRSLLHGARRLR